MNEPQDAHVAMYHARTGDRPRFSYPVTVMRWRPCHVIVSGVFGPEVEGRSPIFRPGDRTAEFFWSKRWWNVIAGYRPDSGALTGYYCNVAKTPRWHAGADPTIAYTDLDLDIIVFPDGRIELHDEDEFVDYAARFSYPQRTIDRARQTADEIIAAVERRAHPFRFESLPALCTRLHLPLPDAKMQQSV